MSEASIIARLDRELESKGFARRRSTWNRAHDSLVDVIDIQVSKGGDTVTLNAGILSRPVYRAVWGRDAGDFVEEPFCTIRVRVGQLLGNKDRWWSVSESRSDDELAECTHSHVLPFLDRVGTLEEMRNWLATNGIPSPKLPLASLCLAVLQSQLGDLTGACKLLAVIEDKALGNWKNRAREVAVRIGCPPRN
jgi:hypothetical protein